MQISILLPRLRLYGGIRRMLEIANRMSDAGHDVTIYHSDGSACDWMDVRAKILPASAITKREHEHLLYIFPEHRAIAHGATARRLYHYNLNLYNKRLLLIPSWISFFLRGIFAVHRAYYIRRAVLDARATILVNCTDSEKWLKEHFGITAVSILGAVNSKIFYPVVSRKNSGTTILHLGSPKYWKGNDIVKAAVALVRHSVPDVISESFYDKGISQDQMAAVYGRADVFADAQLYAGWNNPIAEAMACKIPVVCYDSGPNRDIAIHEQTALLVPPKRTDLMAKAIERIINDKVLRDRLVENAYRAIQPFTWERTTNDLLAVLTHANH